ncbi:hypothetical protein [Synechococcus sp. CCY 9618]|uniref:hypothetical protein n=1 Tax=Synechococcus sp. CCY 9618 TaxID=2815602 RepID=UPI001C244F0F|nr:hypothetical protein [Synechococcus sp. CCY 9618]
MPLPPQCHILSIDFQDLDVIWNVTLFYEATGFTVSRRRPPCGRPLDLLVILRGDPGETHREHRGDVHIYDYVKELQVDWRRCFPHARRIRLISLFRPASLAPGVHWVEGYLPVIPAFWQRSPFRKRLTRPLHIANFKPIGDDPFQRDLAELARRDLIQVHGRHWERLGLHTQGLSYLEANRLLARSWCCYGLMYPYQRGTTLSGRMWQAPLHGCLVISERGTNPLGLPGVREVETFGPDTLLSVRSIRECAQIRNAATSHWRQATERLAQQLELPPCGDPSAARLAACRRAMLAQHLQVVWNRRLQRAARWLAPPPISCWLRRRQRTLQGVGRILHGTARRTR